MFYVIVCRKWIETANVFWRRRGEHSKEWQGIRAKVVRKGKAADRREKVVDRRSDSMDSPSQGMDRVQQASKKCRESEQGWIEEEKKEIAAQNCWIA